MRREFTKYKSMLTCIWVVSAGEKGRAITKKKIRNKSLIATIVKKCNVYNVRYTP